MCGIAGKISFNGDPVDRSLIHAMCNAMVHRGPDAEGLHIDSGVGLGQRRLSIIDLSADAAPPLCNEDESIWLVFNGEIYNFPSLREMLIERGHRFRSRTDTEVVIHLYEEHGVGCLDHLRGMFAFALWDRSRGKLFAARDRLGKKPFYYATNSSALTFGSSVSAVVADPGVNVRPDFAAIDQYLQWQYVPSPLTAFENIAKLPAGHYLVCDRKGKVEVSRYWAPPIGEISQDLVDPVEARHELLTALRDSVRLRLMSDVPLGALLSGGIDSGSVVALMAMESPQRVKTFSVGFEGDPNNELPYARLVAERFSTDHHEYLVNASVVDALPLLVRHYGEPFADSSAIPTYFVTQMARQEVTVALSGDGGDESFSGYDRYGELLRWQLLDKIPDILRNPLFTSLSNVSRTCSNGGMGWRVSKACRMAAASLSQRYEIYTAIFKAEERHACYSPMFKALLASARDVKKEMRSENKIPALDLMMNHDQQHYLPDCLMVKADVASMANSLELRAPFLDHEFMELAARIPAGLKRVGMRGKIILKETVAPLLPPEVLGKPKTGFGVPLAQWFRTELKTMLNETLLSDQAMRRGLFNPPFVRRMVSDQLSGKRDWSNRLWALLFLELWFREFID